MKLFPFGFWKTTTPPPAGWTPADFSELRMWLTAAVADSLTVDGSNQLVGWADQSGNGVDGIPSTGTIPVRQDDVLRGRALLKLANADTFQTVKDPMAGGAGIGWPGPIAEAFIFKAVMASNDATQQMLTVDGRDGLGQINGQGGKYNLFNLGFYPVYGGSPEISNDLTGIAYDFLSSNWPGPINAGPSEPATIIVINLFGPTDSKAQIFFIRPASGSIPAYFATLPTAPFTHDLSSAGAKKLFWGAATNGGEQYPAEYFIATDAPATLNFDDIRDYCIRQWIGTMRNFVLCLGDSLTGGFGIGQANAYPYLLGQLQTGKDFANVGINGRTVAGLGDDWAAYQSLKRPGIDNWVNVWICTNDIAGGASADNCLTASRFLIDQIRASGWKSRFIDCIPRNFGAPAAGNPQDPVKEAFRIDFNARLEEVGADAYVRLTDSAPYNDPNAWMSTEFYMDDQVHQNAAGNARTAELINAVS